MNKRQRALEIALLLAVVIFATALRLWDLSQLPSGFHGDEAVSGLEAQRIWRENGIGPYTGAALGQPTGPIYIVALAMRIFGETVFAVRFVSALAGVWTIVVLYFFARRFFDWQIALLSAFLLTISNWHLHFSRIGFPVAAWPLFVLLGLWVLLEAIERRHHLWWIFAGAVLGSGLYIYNAHWLFIAIACGFALWQLGRDKNLAGRTRFYFLGAFFGALVFAAVPMLLYASKAENAYASHFELYSLFSRAEWLEASFVQRGVLLLQRYFDFWLALCWQPRVDYADATGIVSPLPMVLVFLGFFGAFCSWKTRRDSSLILCVSLLIFLPLGSVMTIDGAMRRTLALTPILALLSALGLGAIFHSIARQHLKFRLPLRVALAGFLLFVSVQTLRNYFVVFRKSPLQEWTLMASLRQASFWMNNLPRDAHVYFLSERWPESYSTRQFLAPAVWIEDRSSEHGVFSLENDERDSESVWLLMGNYQRVLPKLRALYPGGQVIEGPLLPTTNEKSFTAYRRRKP